MRARWILTGMPERVRLDAAYRLADQLEWAGEPWSSKDCSPTRRSGATPALLLSYMAATDAWDALEHGDHVNARRHLEWAEGILTRAKIPLSTAENFLAPVRQRLAALSPAR